jgi:hypothetical protein
MIKHFFFVLFVSISLSLSAQESTLDQKFNLENKNYLFSELLEEISQKTQFEFSYTSDLNGNKKICLPSKTYTVKSLLKLIINPKEFKIITKKSKIFIVFIPAAERKYRISGFISDSNNSEMLLNATVANLSNMTGSVSNNFGFYSLSVKNSKHRIQYSFVGYEDIIIDLSLKSDTTINIALKPKTTLKEVRVTANTKSNNINQLFVSTTTLNSKNLTQNGVLGEKDLFNNIQQLAGVQMPFDGLSGFVVRNSSADQNLILLDDVPIYYSSHLLGLYSVFNPDAINQVKMIKGGFPAHYGGRIASVLDIRMKDGNTKKISGDFNIGLLTAKFNLNGPIVKNKTTFNISLRRSYLDLFTRGFFDKNKNKIALFFGDLNWKVVHRFSQRDKVYLSGYFGGDMLSVKETDEVTPNLKDKFEGVLAWGNYTNSLKWNHVYNNHLFGNTSLILSRYTFLHREKNFQEINNQGFKQNHYYRFSSGVRDYSFKSEFDFIPDYKHYLKFGVEGSLHYTKPGNELLENKNDMKNHVGKKKTISSEEINVYGECQIKFGKKFLVNMGTRWSNFFVENTYYSTIEPRLNAQYFILPQWSFTGSFSQMTQYLHLAKTSNFSLPTDIWIPVTKKIKPIDAFQYTLGTHYKFSKSINVAVETYHKFSKNILELKDTYFFQDISTDIESMVESGKSWAKGLEVSLNKTEGKLNGSLTYTWAKSEMKFPNLNKGVAFPSHYDRRHNLSLQWNQKLSKKIQLSIFWNYGTGIPTTIANKSIPAISPYDTNTKPIPIFDGRNQYRLPDYHRLDLSLKFSKKKKKGIRTWNLSIYNLYNRKNPNLVYLKKNYRSNNYSLKQLSIFTFIPSISYTYKF